MTLILNCGIIVLISILASSLPLFKKWDEKFLRLFISFGAGTLLGATFLTLIPEVIEGGFHEGGFFILLGFTSLYILEKFVMVHPCEENHCHVHHIGFSAFVGLSIHNLVDGFVLGSSSLVPSLGSVVLFAILAHKGPSAFSLSSILLYSKYSKSKIWLLNIVFALLIPFGALFSSYFLSGIDREKILLCIAFSAGTFLHVATSDLLPEIHKNERWKPGNLIALILGITLILLNGHSH